MKNLIIAFSLITLSACAANPASYGSVKQNYRPKGEDKTITIESRLIVKKNLLDNDYAVVFKVDENYQLGFNLNQNGDGGLSCITNIEDSKDGKYLCKPHNGHKIGANCVGSTANGNFASTQCSFLYDDEIAANFKF